MESFDTLDSGEEAVDILGDGRWPQTANQGGGKV